ncbi:MAG: CDP-diacylglycerol--glycerol-3-phosphate 3-phosphatidyltransferase [Bacilli bacterium]|nr:CDP-diacylglycerol--glycerol-3-phosphate 3-phosphatidyltransferase [Bacilli bacterium]
MKQLPNVLTLIRIGLVPLYWFVFFSPVLHHDYLALGVFLLAGATDVLDGFIARHYQLVSHVGMLLDPLADKLMMLTVVASFLVAGQIPWITAFLLVFRDAAMIACGMFFHFRGKKTVPATIWGKSTTVLYYIGFVANILNYPYAPELLWVIVLCSYATGFVYLFDFRKLNGLRKLSFDTLPILTEEEEYVPTEPPCGPVK